MTTSRALLTALSLAGLALSSPAMASAASTSFGPGPAKACYDAAKAGTATLAALSECDAAVTGQDLNSRDRAATLVNRGVLRLMRREPDAAIVDFELALRLRPELGEAHVNRGAALILLGRHDEAVAAISTGLQIGSEDEHEAHFNRALAYERLGETAKAYADFRRAQELKPDWDLPRLELARFSVRPR